MKAHTISEDLLSWEKEWENVNTVKDKTSKTHAESYREIFDSCGVSCGDEIDKAVLLSPLENLLTDTDVLFSDFNESFNDICKAPCSDEIIDRARVFLQ